MSEDQPINESSAETHNAVKMGQYRSLHSGTTRGHRKNPLNRRTKAQAQQTPLPPSSKQL